MSAQDDRPWKAEDMLRSVVEVKAGGTASTRERVEQFFDRVETSPSALPTVSLEPKAHGAVRGGAGRADAAPGRAPFPTVPPVEVPNHEFVRCLGAGGFGQVWLAKHTLTEHHRACKLIPADKALELDGLKRLKQKVPGHPNLFPIEEVGAAEDWLYCLMPLADNATSDHAILDTSEYEPLTLSVYLQRHGRRPTAETASIGLEIAEAVRVLHEHGVTHGDVKPGNILRFNGRWTLADYGLARGISDPSGGGHTPGYVPPEGLGTRSADLYALGIALMDVLTTWEPRMLPHFRKVPIRRLKLDAAGSLLADIILRATADDPNERFGSVGELIDALRPLASAASAGDSPSHDRPRRWIWPGLAFAATLALAFGVWNFLLRQQVNQTTPPAAVAAPNLIESFEVRHYRYDPATDTTVAIGPINADNPAAREGDDVTLHARLSGESYVYLLSLDADGRVRPRIPASPTDRPGKTARVDYPSLPAGTPDDVLYNLSRGPGTHGFMLLTSANPLPSWSNWIAAHGEPSWTRESLPPNGVILFDGRETTYASATREPMPRRGQLLLDPIDWAKSQQGLVAAFIAFPVLPSEKD